MIHHPDDRPPERRFARLRRQLLHPDPEQVRQGYVQAKLIELAGSLKAVGQQQPLLVWPDSTLPAGHFRITDGHRRYYVLPFADLEEVDCVIVDKPLDRLEATAIPLTLGATNERLSPFELAEGALQLMRGKNFSQEDVAALIGMSPSKLSKILAVKDLAEELRPDVESGVIPVTSAAQLARLKVNVAAQLDLAAKIRAGTLKRDAVPAAVNKLLGKGGDKPVKPRELKNGPAVLTVPGDWELDRIIDWLTGRLKAARKCSDLNLPPDSIDNF